VSDPELIESPLNLYKPDKPTNEGQENPATCHATEGLLLTSASKQRPNF
jgi:hypothetical protein